MFIEAAGPGSAAGPVGTIIGGLIDLGELFAGFELFGGDGASRPGLPLSHQTPVILQPSPDYDWQGSGSQPPDNTAPDGFGGGAASGMANSLTPANHSYSEIVRIANGPEQLKSGKWDGTTAASALPQCSFQSR